MPDQGTNVHHVPLSVVAGRRDLGLITVVDGGDPSITWAVASELVEAADYLRGGELLLTAGVNLPTTTAEVRAYVASLIRAGVCAVGFGMAPVHATVPPPLIEQCHAQGLPLLEVPPSTPFAAVSRAVGEELEERHLRDLRRLGESHQALARAVTAPAPVDRLLTVLADALGAWAALVPAEPGAPVRRTIGAPTEPAPEVRALVAKLTAPTGPRSAKVAGGPDEVFLHTVGAPPEHQGVVLVGRPRSLAITDRAVLRTATALLELLLRAPGEEPPVPGLPLTALLLDGALNPRALAALAALADTRAPASGDLRPRSDADPAVGDPADGGYRVLRAAPLSRGRRTAAGALPLGTHVTDLAPDTEGSETVVRAVLADRGEQAHREQLDLLRSHGWIGALSAVTEPEGLPEADREAGALLVRARTVGGPLAGSADGEPFDALLNAQAGGLSRRVLGPLDEDTATARTLRTTLHAWLARHGSWDRAAGDLGVHRNSVRYRIGRIERDLGVDLADPERRMRLWFALTRRDGRP
ncbi:PucR family transcriptional regulator ligand-binding domain-containing protein [Nocardiopsis sp. MG754419]|uniref:PucR family transcriptional regulator ligand-binding domain-containing protein n=1 Tax=Nocardiopsis sp. MG754419 TaxID=2259865 RepID=UPI001BA7C133|nr:PucR family transcriptional regulator ligand-binding domain-containing protein [Nocardiopsis sp. MG754419]MBR8742395.1 PucR family transcriptional regulator [Nocardiopsis sp. MG754419]